MSDNKALLAAVLARCDRGDAPDSKWPDSKGEYWALCPFHHDRHATNFSVSERGYNCFVCSAKGSLRQLAEHLGIDHESRQSGLTLTGYAAAKHLPVPFLESLGVREVNGKYGPYLEMPYHDEKGNVMAVRRRFRLHKSGGKDDRFAWQKGSRLIPYGLERLPEIRKAGWLLLVEGESDCQTAWHLGLPALGVPGASTWKPGWTDYLKGLRVFVWAEPDEGGAVFAATLTHDIPCEVMNPPDGIKDLSEAHCKGMDVLALVEKMKANAGPMKAAKTLADLAPWVRQQLGKRSDRNTKLSVAGAILDWLVDRRRLFLDVAQDSKRAGRPYLLADDGALWPIEPDNMATKRLLHEAGLNSSEAAYRFVVEEVIMTAYKQGQPVRLQQWQQAQTGVLYVSCGPTHLVRAEGGKLMKLANGTDGVWFAGDFAYPEWRPVAPVPPLSLAAFNPNLVAPEEVPAYNQEVQKVLLATWLAALMSGLRPLPALLVIGEKGGGKTRLACGICRMLMGPPPAGDVSSLTVDKRDWWASVTTQPLAALDNVDSDVPFWFADELARVITGVSVKTRQLYTDGERLDRSVTAAVVITTRTTAFARADVAERSLPLLTEEFGDSQRIADSELMAQVDESRDGLLSWATLTAARFLETCEDAPNGLPLRFVDFARLVWAYCKGQGKPELAVPVLQALRLAQNLVIGEADPLVEAIVMYLGAIDAGGSWRGTASELVAALAGAGANLPYLGGGKAIARRLREARGALRLAGIAMQEETARARPVFTLWRMSETSESSESFKSVQLSRSEEINAKQEVFKNSDVSDDSDKPDVGLTLPFTNGDNGTDGNPAPPATDTTLVRILEGIRALGGTAEFRLLSLRLRQHHEETRRLCEELVAMGRLTRELGREMYTLVE